MIWLEHLKNHVAEHLNVVTATHAEALMHKVRRETKGALEWLVSDISAVHSILHEFFRKTEIENVDLVISAHAEVDVLNISMVVLRLLVELLQAIKHCKCDALDLGVAGWASLEPRELFINVMLNVLHDHEAPVVLRAVHNVSWSTSKYVRAAKIPVEETLLEDVVCVRDVSGELDGEFVLVCIAVEADNTLSAFAQLPLKYILSVLERLR
jgi:hypothetical protein